MSFPVPVPGFVDALGTSSTTATTASAPITSPNAPVVSDAPPKPVVPAEAIGEAPVRALDPLTEPTFLEKARDMAMPYIEKVEHAAHPYVEKAKPYTDAGIAKAKELIDRVEGVAPPNAAPAVGTTPTPITPVPSTTTTAADRSVAGGPTTGEKAVEKAQGMFESISASVQNTFNTVTHTIDEKTASEGKPGLVTRVENAVKHGVEKVDAFLDKQLDGTAVPATTSTIAESATVPVVPASTGAPVTTTTNTVPHAL